MSADLVFQNGQVLTMNERQTICEALAVRGNKIVAVGSRRDIEQWIGKQTEVIDLRRRSLLPGFIDAHAHPELYGTNALGVNCKTVGSITEMKQRLKERAKETKPGNWIRGWGYNQNFLDEKRHPTRYDLDEVSREHPIIVVRTCGHISAVNSRALELAGIENNTPDPDGGKFVRDRDGKPNGVLLEAAHMNMFLTAQHSKEDIMKGLAIASSDYLAKGITSVHDAGGYDSVHFRHLFDAVKTGVFKQRVYFLYGALHDAPAIVQKGLETGMKTGIGDESFRIGPAKVFIDGSSSGPTAKTRQPYTSNPGDSGILYLNQQTLTKVLGQAHECGWQVTAHAIGDQAVEMMLNCIEEALEKAPRDDHRHRIEHAAMTPPDLLKKMKNLNVVPVANPAFIYEFGDGYVQDYGERVETMFPLQFFVKEGIPVALGSDSPITTFDPLVGIYAAVNRKSKTGNGIGTSQKVELLEVLKMYTVHGAYASFEEKIKGSLEPGKLADLAVLNRSILDVPKEALKDVEVDLTVLDGKIVYNREREEVKT